MTNRTNMPRAANRAACLAVVLLAGAAPLAAQAGLALEDVQVLLRERNPRLKAARAMTDATGARESMAGLLPDPTFQLGAMNLAMPGFSASMPNSMVPSARAMMMVPFPGKLGLSGRIAGQSTSMAEAGALEVWWEVRSQAAMAFYEIWQADRQIEVMRKTLGLLHDFEQVARAMYASGAGRQSDVLRANVEVARMDAEIIRMHAMRQGAAARLNALIDRPADAPVDSPRLGALPATVPVTDTLRAWAALGRPMLERSRIGVEQAETRRSLAHREIWPDFTVGIEYGQRPMADGTARMASAMIGFSLPIFAGRRQLRMRDEAVAMEQMARAELSEMQAGVDARIGELLADLERTRSLVRLYRTEILPQADANVQSAFSSYRVGAVDFMTLVDAEMTANRFESELYGLMSDYGRSIADLEMTVGRELPVTGETIAEAS
jgi:outer membrane protein, heavy metal efflux system